jgi:hypothetical protein
VNVKFPKTNLPLLSNSWNRTNQVAIYQQLYLKVSRWGITRDKPSSDIPTVVSEGFPLGDNKHRQPA